MLTEEDLMIHKEYKARNSYCLHGKKKFSIKTYKEKKDPLVFLDKAIFMEPVSSEVFSYIY